MVCILLSELDEKVNQFSCYHLMLAGTLVENHIYGNVTEEQYQVERDRLAGETRDPDLMKCYMDYHHLRGIKNRSKTQISY